MRIAKSLTTREQNIDYCYLGMKKKSTTSVLSLKEPSNNVHPKSDTLLTYNRLK